MCRLFGLLGNGRSTAEPWLATSERSLLRQSDASSAQIQTDGWGIAWVTPGEPRHLEKGIRGAHEPGEIERFRAAAHRARGPLVMAHLRKASNPMKLPEDRLRALENSQPFAFRQTLFAHNGSIFFPRETRPLLGAYEEKVQGINDSEILFLLLLKRLDEIPEPVAAYSRVMADLFRVWQERGSPRGGPYSGLNVLFSRGPEELFAFCNSRGEHGTGLLDTSAPYYQMAYRADPREVVVASEPCDANASGWKPLVNGQYLHARVERGLVGLRTGTIPLPPELKAIA